jgi:hypothetical protein
MAALRIRRIVQVQHLPHLGFNETAMTVRTEAKTTMACQGREGK